MRPEHNNHIPDWAQRERWTDLAWINDNLPAFTSAARIAYEHLGRGASVIAQRHRILRGVPDLDCCPNAA